jgi:hypothetical protein
MIDVNMGHDQCPDIIDRELDGQGIRAGAFAGGLGALEQATVDQDGIGVPDAQFMTGTGDATDGTMMQDVHFRIPRFACVPFLMTRRHGLASPLMKQAVSADSATRFPADSRHAAGDCFGAPRLQ